MKKAEDKKKIATAPKAKARKTQTKKTKSQKTMTSKTPKGLLKEKRQAPRKQVLAPALCNPTQDKQDLVSGVTEDKSDTGVGLFTSVNIPTGLFLEIESEAFSSAGKKVKRRKIALVQWSKKIKKDLYRVGLSFVD